MALSHGSPNPGARLAPMSLQRYGPGNYRDFLETNP